MKRSLNLYVTETVEYFTLSVLSEREHVPSVVALDFFGEF